MSAVGRNNITFNHIPKSMRVCSRHFISGKPAYEMLEADPDWLPSLHLGHGEGGGGRRAERLPLALQATKEHEKKRLDAENDAPTLAAVRRPVVPPWTDVKSLLQSVLPKKPDVSVEPRDETPLPAAVKTDVSFRDFFREALEASLDACSRSRTGSSRPPYEVELSIQLPPVKDEKTCEESSSCLNCVRLQTRVQQLEERLSALSGPPEDTDGPAVLSEPPTQRNQVLHSPEQTRLQPISPPPLLQGGRQDADSAAGRQDDSAKQTPRSGQCVTRFQKAWLKTFWFLRYSPTQNLMWCHVCRLHADKAHHNLSLIKGSRMFKVYNIKKHSCSNYHRDSVERHMLQR